MHWIKEHSLLIGVAGLIVGINIFLLYISPEEVVTAIGVENIYVVTFLLGAIGGLSTLTGAALYATIITFAVGGATPALLGLSAGLGIFVSDTVFYHVALYGKMSIPDKTAKKLSRITDTLLGFSKQKMLLFTYLYQSFLPLPSDVLMVFLVFAGYKYRTVAPVFLAASLTLGFLLAYFGSTFY